MNALLVQAAPTPGALRDNLITLTQTVHTALATTIGQQTHIVAASAGAVTGHPLYALAHQSGLGALVLSELTSAAASLHNTPPIVLTGLPPAPGKSAEAAQGQGVFVLHAGAVLPLSGTGIVEVAGLRCGVRASYDPSTLQEDMDALAAMVTGGAQALFHVAALPYVYTRQQQLDADLSALAQGTGVPVYHVNQAGCMDGMVYGGQSMAWAGHGRLSARAASFEADALYSVSGHMAPAPGCQEEAWWQALVHGLRAMARACGFSQAVLGLSGGMDSALVAAIAADALGAEQVLGVLLPSPWSSQGSIDDALALAAHLGMPTHTVPIAPLMQAAEQALAPVFSGRAADVTEENLQSRIRGQLLMALSNKCGRMVLATGNKSEVAVGYCTLYGDTCGALSVIADLYKTEVYRLGRWLNASRGREIIPESVLVKAPSAELRPGQTDQDSLPPYEVLDAILQQLVEQRRLPSEVDGQPQIIAHVVRLLRRAEFKRWQCAPGLSLSVRPFGAGWHMPINAVL